MFGLKMPPEGHAVWEKVERADVERAAAPGGRARLPSFAEVGRKGRKMIAESGGQISAVNFLVCRMSDSAIALVEVKAKSSNWLWIFGEPSSKGHA